MAHKARCGIRPGPMSLLVLTLTLCLAVLAVLALATAAAGERRAQVQAHMAADSYRNECAAQELFADASDRARAGGPEAVAALAEEVASRWDGASASFDDGTLAATFCQPSGRSLSVELSVGADGSVSVASWRPGVRWETPSAGLWQGP